MMGTDFRTEGRLQILGGPDDGDYHYVTMIMQKPGVVVKRGSITYIIIELPSGSKRLQYVSPERANGG